MPLTRATTRVVVLSSPGPARTRTLRALECAVASCERMHSRPGALVSTLERCMSSNGAAKLGVQAALLAADL
jgi:hypothetical protein